MIDRLPLRDRARGRWHAILPALGVDPERLVNRHGPCPVCGGKDRFRFDNKGGNGTYFCNQCGAGDGIKLVMSIHGLEFKDVARRIEAVMDDGAPIPQPEPQRSVIDKRAALNALWQRGGVIQYADPVDLWLRHRGIDEPYPRCLRSARRIRHYDGDTFTEHPAMLAMVSAPDGKPATIHKTYLTHGGEKALVADPRKLACAPFPKGGAIRLATAGATLGIAEGIETAMSASRIFGVPVWAAISADMLAAFEPPPETKRLLIFADNDAPTRRHPHGHGRAAADALAARLASRLLVEIEIPTTVKDWNDVLLSERPTP